MMEFILSRTSACICAAVILVLLSAPVMDHFDDQTDMGKERNCDAIGKALDRFMSGSADESVLSLNTYLPGSAARIFCGSWIGCPTLWSLPSTARNF